MNVVINYHYAFESRPKLRCGLSREQSTLLFARSNNPNGLHVIYTSIELIRQPFFSFSSFWIKYKNCHCSVTDVPILYFKNIQYSPIVSENVYLLKESCFHPFLLHFFVIFFSFS